MFQIPLIDFDDRIHGEPEVRGMQGLWISRGCAKAKDAQLENALAESAAKLAEIIPVVK